MGEGGDVPSPTERLTFRRWDAQDAARVLEIYARPEVYQFLGAVPAPVESLEEARERIDRWAERTTGLGGIWAVQRRDRDEAPVGTALLVPLPRTDGGPSDAYEIGWHLHPDAWGRGLATEAAVALLDRARDGGLDEVRAVVFPDNLRSREVCRRLGMAEVGLTREWYGVELVEYRLDLAEPASPDVLAVRIAAARCEHRVLAAPTDHGLDADGAYRAQGRVLAARMAEGGGRGGWKLGYTSAVMRQQMGIEEPNFGPLSRGMLLTDGALIDEGVTQPRIEPELAAVLGADVPPDADEAEVRGAIARWRLALEVVDSVWEGYWFDWALNTADGSSAGFVVLGDEVGEPDLAAVEVLLERNGTEVGRGTGAAAMGDPVRAVAWLAAQLAESGEWLRAGDVVITGGLTAAVPFEPGDRITAMTVGTASARVSARRASG